MRGMGESWAPLPLFEPRGVQLAHRDRLRIDRVDVHLLLLRAALGHLTHRRRQRALDARLRAERVADDHQPVADDDRLVELRHL